jgi:hypothetical protein
VVFILGKLSQDFLRCTLLQFQHAISIATFLKRRKNMNFKKIKARNIAHIEYCVEQLEFKKDADEIIALANVFVQSDLNKRTLRLIGESKETVDGKVKYKKMNLFSLTQKYQKDLSETTINQIFQDIGLIVPYHTQLKYMNKIKDLEGDQVKTYKKLAKILADTPKIKI